MNPRSTLRALRFRRKKKWSEFSTRNCGTTQISDSYALAPSITLNPSLEPDRLRQEKASSSGMGRHGQFAQQRGRAGHIRLGQKRKLPLGKTTSANPLESGHSKSIIMRQAVVLD